LPRPGALKANIRNEHLQYAITWYGLASALTIMFVFWLRNHRRKA
jgi:cytochrome oxidase assembly protein ShyY1